MSKNYLFRDDRWTGFPKLIDKLGCKIGIEIGVAFGEFSEHLLMFTDLELLYGLDSCPQWDAVKDIEERFAPRYKFIDGYSPTYAENFPNEYFDFIYLDAGHDISSVRRDFYGWWPKLKEGGLYAGDDYLCIVDDHPECLNFHTPRLGWRVIDIVQDATNRLKIPYYVTGCDSNDEQERLIYATEVWNKLKPNLDQAHKTIQIPQWWLIK